MLKLKIWLHRFKRYTVIREDEFILITAIVVVVMMAVILEAVR